jgi:hypothetical protein
VLMNTICNEPRIGSASDLDFSFRDRLHPHCQVRPSVVWPEDVSPGQMLRPRTNGRSNKISSAQLSSA